MRLTDPEIAGGLAELSPAWRSDGRALHLSLKFQDFAAAHAAVNQVAALAEEASHHPDITLGWGYCSFRLTTHSEDGLTAKDLKLAKLIDATIGS